MGVVSRCVTYSDFVDLFNKFSEKVKEKKYAPISYKQYKEFYRDLMSMSHYDMIVDYDSRDHVMLIFTDVKNYTFEVDGNSFGAFLFDELSIEHSLWNDYDMWDDPYRDYYKPEKVMSTSALNYPVKNYKLKEITTNEGAVKEIKEDNTMKFNFDFGPVAGEVRMSLYGLAVKNKAGTWVSYDAKSGDIMDVDILNFEGAKFLYKMPVAIKDIAIGDVIIHHRVPMFVVAIAVNGGYVTAVDPIAGERKDIMLTKSPFGFNFVTKVVNVLGNSLSGTASAENPFGNLGLMMMLSDEGGNGVKEMLPLMMLANGGVNGLDMSNPMVLYMLCKDGTGDLPVMLALSGAFNKPVVPSEGGCTCGNNCGHKE